MINIYNTLHINLHQNKHTLLLTSIYTQEHTQTCIDTDQIMQTSLFF